jgi:hypothetical protein
MLTWKVTLVVSPEALEAKLNELQSSTEDNIHSIFDSSGNLEDGYCFVIVSNRYSQEA